jgi:hypothetical protein
VNCKYHKDEEAKFICDKCKQPVCEECTQDVNGRRICKSCIERSVYAGQRQVAPVGFWNKLFFFILACIPGAAQMQMGLFKRGMQLMVTFIGAFALISYVNMESFIPLLIIPTWFFSFFDAYNNRKKVLGGIGLEDHEAYNYRLILENKRVLGAILLVFGFMGILNAVENIFYDSLYVFGIRVNGLYWLLKRTIIPFIFVLAGFVLIHKANKKKEEFMNTEEN